MANEVVAETYGRDFEETLLSPLAINDFAKNFGGMSGNIVEDARGIGEAIVKVHTEHAERANAAHGQHPELSETLVLA